MRVDRAVVVRPFDMGPARLRGRAGCVRGRIDRVAQNPTGRLAADGIRAPPRVCRWRTRRGALAGRSRPAGTRCPCRLASGTARTEPRRRPGIASQGGELSLDRFGSIEGRHSALCVRWDGLEQTLLVLVERPLRRSGTRVPGSGWGSSSARVGSSRPLPPPVSSLCTRDVTTIPTTSAVRDRDRSGPADAVAMRTPTSRRSSASLPRRALEWPRPPTPPRFPVDRQAPSPSPAR